MSRTFIKQQLPRLLLPCLGISEETVSPGSYLLVADIDTSLVEQVFDLPLRQGKTDIHHDRQADDIGWSLEITE